MKAGRGLGQLLAGGIKINIGHAAFHGGINEIQAPPVYGCAWCVSEPDVLPFRSLREEPAIHGNGNCRVEKQGRAGQDG